MDGKLIEAAGLALEVLKKHQQFTGEAPAGLLGVNAIEALTEALRQPAPDEPVREPDGWKCSECHNVNNAQGVVPGEGWCSLCGAVGSMDPLYAAPPAPQPEPFAFVQEVAGYAPRLFLASECPDMMNREWVEGVTIRPLYLPPPAPQPRVPLPSWPTEEQPDGTVTPVDPEDMHPAPKRGGPLTDWQIDKIRFGIRTKAVTQRDHEIARAIEAAHGIKSEGE